VDTDGGLYALFKKNIRGHFVRIESGWTSTGVPDAEYCIDGDAGYIEFKQARGGRVTIRTLQSSFAEARTAAGGRVALAVKVGSGLKLYDGRAMRTLLLDPKSTPVKGGKSCRIDAVEGQELYAGDGRVDWRMVTEVLRR
jgi:hypothetical protein